MKLHLAAAIIVLGALLGGCAVAPRPSPAEPDAQLQALMEKAQVPGLALALIRDGRVVRTVAYGWADREQGVPLRTDTIMYGASLTKAAFAYMVLQLVDEGGLALDEPLPRL